MIRPNLESIIRDPQAASGSFRGCERACELLVQVAQYAQHLEYQMNTAADKIEEHTRLLNQVTKGRYPWSLRG